MKVKLKYRFALLFIFSCNHLFSQWLLKSLPSTSHFYGLEYATTNDVWIAGSDGLCISNNGGATFSLVHPMDQSNNVIGPAIYQDVHLLNSSTAITTGFMFLGNTEAVLKSTNAGINWSANHLVTGTFTAEYSDIDFPTATTGYCAGYNGKILKSTNSGDTWSLLTTNSTDDIFAVKFYNTMKGVAGGSYGILNTTDGGVTWAKTTFSATEFYGVSWADSTTVYAAGIDQGDPLIMKSVNGGSTWNPLPVQFPDACKDIFAVSSDTLIVATYDKLYRSTDGGLYWDEYVLPTYTTWMEFTKIDFLDANRGYAVGRNGYCISTNNGGILKPFLLLNPTSIGGNICQYDTLFFNNTSNPAYNYSWYVDSVLVSTNYQFNYVDTTRGAHSIQLIVDNGLVADTVAYSYNVIALPVVPLFNLGVVDSICPSYAGSVKVLNPVSGVYYELRKGYQVVTGSYGTTGSALNLTTGSLTQTTAFNVRASKFNSCGGDSSIVFQSVIVDVPVVNLPFTALEDTICEGEYVKLAIANSVSTSTYNLQQNGWQVIPMTPGTNDTLFFSLGPAYCGGTGGLSSNTYTVYAQTATNCFAPLTTQQEVYIQCVDATINTGHPVHFLGDTVQFSNTSVEATMFNWTFGASASPASSTLPSEQVTYSTVGTKDIQFIGSSSAGCADTVGTQIEICNPSPTAPAVRCFNDIVEDGKHMVNDFYMDKKGNYYVTGYFYEPYGNNAFHFFAASFDSSGNVKWYKYEHSGGLTWVLNSYGTGIVADIYGNVYVTGQFTGTYLIDLGFTFIDTYKTPKMFIAKYDSTGNLKWVIKGKPNATQHYGYGTYASDIAIDEQQRLYVTGGSHGAATIEFPSSTYNLTNFNGQAFLFVIDSLGTLLASESFSQSGAFYNNINFLQNASNGSYTEYDLFATNPKISVLKNGNVALAGSADAGANLNFGTFSLYSPVRSVFYVEYNINQGWIKGFECATSPNEIDPIQAFAVDSAYNVYITGRGHNYITFNGTQYILDDNEEQAESYLLKIDSAGVGAYLSHTGYGFIHDIEITSQNNVVVAAQTHIISSFKDGSGYAFGLASNGEYDYSLFELDQTGNLIWAKNFGDSLIDFPYYIELDDCDDIHVCAGIDRTFLYWPFPTYCVNCPDDGSLAFAKVAADGNCIKSNCFSNPAGIQSTLPASLVMLYPNPFNETFNILLPQTMDLSLEIYTLEGRQVDKINLHNQTFYSYDASHLKSGMYFLRFQSRDAIYQQKIIKN